jgi:hypothetical protein
MAFSLSGTPSDADQQTQRLVQHLQHGHHPFLPSRRRSTNRSTSSTPTAIATAGSSRCFAVSISGSMRAATGGGNSQCLVSQVLGALRHLGCLGLESFGALKYLLGHFFGRVRSMS